MRKIEIPPKSGGYSTVALAEKPLDVFSDRSRVILVLQLQKFVYLPVCGHMDSCPIFYISILIGGIKIIVEIRRNIDVGVL